MIASVRLTVCQMMVQCVVVLVAVLLPAAAATANASDTAFPSTTTTFSSSVSPTASMIEGPVSVDVSPVVELTVGSARAAVEELGLVLTGAGEGEDELIVASQDPEAGTAVPGGSTVTVTVVRPPTVDVPPVVDLTVEAARAAVVGDDLVLAGASEGEDELIVDSQDPEAGTAVPVGSTVTVTLVRRPEPTADVPPVVELTVGAARAAVEGDELVFAGAGEGEDELIVASQDPEAGTVVPVGSTVTVTVLRPPPVVVPDVTVPDVTVPEVTVPDVVNLTVEAARTAVERKGSS